VLERVLPVLVGALVTVAVIWWLAGRVDQPRVTGGALGGEVTGAALVAGGQDLLPPGPGSRARAEGLGVAGNELRVSSLRTRGFLAGADRGARVFVLWEGEPPPRGATVDVLGVVAPVPGPAALRRLDRSVAALVRTQGGYVAADEVQADAPSP
jgi:hypothetical protein